ncbi:MAG: hypothetical protein HKM07_03855 [Chlamydiae bacterium]|nr:hypothetical protein [Chlamydiota bacterium]
MRDLKRRIEKNISKPFIFFVFCNVCYFLFTENNSPWMKWPFIIVATLGFVSQVILIFLGPDEEKAYNYCEVKDNHS